MFETLDTLSLSFAREAFDATSGTVALWLNGFMIAYLIFFSIQLITKGQGSPYEVGSKLALFVVAGLFLNTGALWMEWIVFPARDSVTGVAVKIAALSGEVSASGFPELIDAVEKEVFVVLKIARIAINGAGIVGQFSASFGSLFLIIPFLFAWFLFVGFLLEAIFKFMAITAIGPFVVGALLFNATKGFARDSMRIFFSGITGILFMAVAMGFTIAVIKEYVGVLPNPPTYEEVERFFWSGDYFAMVLIGCLSVLFHIIARQMATSVAGVLDSQIASQALLGAGGFAAAKALSGAKAAGRKGGEGLRAGARAGADLARRKIGWGGPNP
ncbi:conserved hypothetical protein [Tepidicaulis marinus]|uniref:TrbL/VirB6 plasmid conjugal transfer protein n=1 Tax=Tepidicaulis marinus TaxID=1333998 RepID=A0A081BF44_9HYPH|nr:type IV secretion system protein [Tepidicaulis marinus]GAK46662.1 conserved hypothetical protein [Tepidicaulis marinus]